MASPIGMMFLGLALGGLLMKAGGRGRVRLGRALVAVSLVLFWVFSCDVTTRIIGAPLEGEEFDVERAVDSGAGKDADAIVLLGGGMCAHRKCGRAEMSAGADRAWMAARLWKRRTARTAALPLTVSGGGAPAERMLLADFGVDTNKVLMLSGAKNTEDEARLIKAALPKAGKAGGGGDGKPQILLVTSASHMPRAKMLFERAGFAVVPAPTDYEMHAVSEAEISIKDFFPNGDSLVRNSVAVKEWVARACYAVVK